MPLWKISKEIWNTSLRVRVPQIQGFSPSPKSTRIVWEVMDGCNRWTPGHPGCVVSIENTPWTLAACLPMDPGRFWQGWKSLDVWDPGKRSFIHSEGSSTLRGDKSPLDYFQVWGTVLNRCVGSLRTSLAKERVQKTISVSGKLILLSPAKTIVLGRFLTFKSIF